MRKIVYVITDNRGLRRYFPFENFSDFDYFYLNCKVIDILSKSKDKIIFKISNSVLKQNDVYKINPILDYIRDNNYKNIIVSEKKFMEELKDSDLVIIDYPTTTLLEAAAFETDIIVFYSEENITIQNCDQAYKALNKRAYIGNTKEEFLNLIEKYIKGDIGNKKNDSTFKELFSINDKIDINNLLISILQDIMGGKI